MKRIFIFLIACILALGVPFSLNGAIYKPGKLRTGKGLRSHLAPLSQEGVEPNHFRVAEATHFPFFETHEKFARAVKELLDEK